MTAFWTRLWAARRALVMYGLLLVAGVLAGDALSKRAFLDVTSTEDPAAHFMVISALTAYVVIAAIPFVPAAEIGLAMLLLFGAKAAPVVYAGMVVALVLSYCVGRLVPISAVARGLNWLGLHKAAQLALNTNIKSTKKRMDMMADKMPSRIAATIFRNRYLVLAIAINTPGNAIVGGGGGLALAAGASKLYPPLPYILCILCAVAPVPLIFWFM